MRLLALLFITSIYTVSAQSIDYNLKKGFVAEGYDVVEYFNNKAIEGNKKFIAKHDNVSYKFTSKENLDTFNSNPKKYAPQYGGYCAYAVAVKGKKVDIDPETFEIRDGKLYLFYNSWGTNTLELWIEENAIELQMKADKNWKTIRKN